MEKALERQEEGQSIYARSEIILTMIGLLLIMFVGTLLARLQDSLTAQGPQGIALFQQLYQVMKSGLAQGILFNRSSIRSSAILGGGCFHIRFIHWQSRDMGQAEQIALQGETTR